jgi:hypothetical protein
MKVSPGCSSARNTRLVHLAAGVRLHVGELSAEQLLGALDRQVLGDIDELAAAVIARARIALGVFVGHHRALRFQHGAGDDVLRGDQLDLVALAAELLFDRGAISGSASASVAEKNESGAEALWAEDVMGEYLHRRSLLQGAGGHGWRSEAAPAEYHIWPVWPRI